MTKRISKPDSDFRTLQRKQLDAHLNRDVPVGRVHMPSSGWIHTIRTALAMSQAQLGRRLMVSESAISQLETREVAGSITLASLAKAADALDCDLRIAFIPRKGLQRAVEEQAARKAREERERIVHTMRLEAQDAGVERSLAEGVDAESWLTTREREIWD